MSRLLFTSDWSTDPLPSLDWGEWSPAAFPVPEQAIVLHEDNRVLARCGLWWQQAPTLEGEGVGVIGQYAAQSAEAGCAVLQAACDYLKQRGIHKVIGPMDGSTWHSHRWVTWSDGEPPFPMEPQQPARWVDDWRGAGFVPLAGYHSSLTSPDTVDESAMNARLQTLEAQGIRIRPIDDARFVEELQAIHALSLQSFADNFLYQPLTLEEFVALYSPFKGRYEPRASALAVKVSGNEKPELVGFIFAYPAPPVDNQTGLRLVLKTLAVQPQLRRLGLGKLLVERANWAAQQAGYAQVIHALMQDDNVSARLRANHTRLFRRYTLFVLDLDAAL